MKLDQKALTGTVAILTAVSYVVCAAVVSVWPALRDVAIHVLFHIDGDFGTLRLSVGLHALSLIVWVAGMSFLAWVFAALYNRLAKA
jgi:hypothetical protein